MANQVVTRTYRARICNCSQVRDENGGEHANPPGYRKHGDDHPRSTVTFKAAGFEHDAENARIRLSKGKNLKKNWSDFVLCEYDVIGPPGRTVEHVQQVRAVGNPRPFRAGRVSFSGRFDDAELSE